MTVTKLIEMLERWNSPEARVRIFDAESGTMEPVTGSVFDPHNRYSGCVIDLQSDER